MMGWSGLGMRLTPGGQSCGRTCPLHQFHVSQGHPATAQGSGVAVTVRLGLEKHLREEGEIGRYQFNQLNPYWTYSNSCILCKKCKQISVNIVIGLWFMNFKSSVNYEVVSRIT